jgi:hypothetical protein
MDCKPIIQKTEDYPQPMEQAQPGNVFACVQIKREPEDTSAQTTEVCYRMHFKKTQRTDSKNMSLF